MNKYKTWYDSIIEKSKSRTLTEYSEVHHIVPRSMGGTDDKNNLARLTAREHFICHWLLIKFTTGDDRGRMINALQMMRAESTHQKRYVNKITARVYATYRSEYAKIKSDMMTGDKNCAKRPGVGEKIRQAKIGVKRAAFSDTWIEKMAVKKRGKNNPRFGATLSDETRKKIGDRIRGRVQTPEEKQIRSLANIGNTHKKKICEHCGKSVAVNGYARWHGPNCRSR